MPAISERINKFVLGKLWGTDLKYSHNIKYFGIKFLRILYLSLHEFSTEQLGLRAESLTYTTLLSVVPLLAFAFSAVKAFGAHRLMEPLLNQFFAPLGPQGQEVTQYLIQFVDKIHVGILGSIGLIVLISTLISVISKIEDTLNNIWKVEHPRTAFRKITDYISVLILGPIFLFTAFAITASAMNTSIAQKIIALSPLGYVIYAASKLMPYIIVMGVLTFVYSFLPNTKINFKSALFGGVFAGALWQISGWAFASFVASSSQYTAIYSSFAIIILFILWIHLGWLIVLIGAVISFQYQFFQTDAGITEKNPLSIKAKERLATLIMFLISYNFYHNKPPWNLYTLVCKLGLPVDHVQNTLMSLKKANLILESGESKEDAPAYLPAKDIATIPLNEIIGSIRTADEGAYPAGSRPPLSVPEVDKIMETMESSIAGEFKHKTIKDIVLAAKGTV